jgi:hypothetical protein
MRENMMKKILCMVSVILAFGASDNMVAYKVVISGPIFTEWWPGTLQVEEVIDQGAWYAQWYSKKPRRYVTRLPEQADSLTYDFEDSEIPGRIRVTRTFEDSAKDIRDQNMDEKNWDAFRDCVSEFIIDSPVKELRLSNYCEEIPEWLSRSYRLIKWRENHVR